MITTVQCSICSQLNNKPRVVVTNFRLHHTCSIIIESVDSISRDERDAPLTQYITNAGITRARYIITHFNTHRYNSAIYVRTARSEKSRFGILLLLSSSNSSSFFSTPSVIVSYLVTLVYM